MIPYKAKFLGAFSHSSLNKGEITIKFGTNKDIVIDDVVSYTPPKGCTTDLSKAQVKGYKFSHKEIIHGIECFVYDPIKPL